DGTPDRPAHPAFFVHVTRQVDGAGVRSVCLRSGALLHLRPEPTNPVNPLAVLVDSEKEQPLGWVPDVLTDYAQHVLAPAVAELWAGYRPSVVRVGKRSPDLRGRAAFVVTTWLATYL